MATSDPRAEPPARGTSHRSRLATATLVVLSVTSLACGDTTDQAGTGESQPPARWTLEQDLRIGSLDGEDALSQVGRIALGPDGRIFVSLSQERRVVVFTPDGARAGSVGREGEGPGEFLAPSYLDFVGDTLWVYDARLGRISFFDAVGEHVGDQRVPEVDGLVEDERATFGTLLADGRALMVTSAGFASEREGTDHPFPLVVVPRQGGAPDTLATRYTAHDRAMFITGTPDNITSIDVLRQVFSDVTAWTATPDGRALVLVDRRPAEGPGPTTWRLTRVGIEGDTAFSVEVPYEPVPVDPARVDSIVARLGGGRRSESEIRDILFLPDFLPPVSDVVAAEDGTIWVAGEDRPEHPVAWDVFDAAGRLLARAETPAGFTAHYATGDALWGVETDELDVPYVVRYWVRR